MRGKGSPYEVRCLRCDVSFPVETRRCIHCGGPTSASESPPPIAFAAGSPLPWTRAPESSARPAGEVPMPSPIPAGGPVEIPEEAPPSLGSTLLKSLGSLFWVIALIGFTIVRSCSEG